MKPILTVARILLESVWQAVSLRLALTALLFAPIAALHAAEPPATSCNPLSIPNYPVGHHARNVTNGEPDSRESWLLGYREQFREQADPTAIWHEGKWHL